MERFAAFVIFLASLLHCGLGDYPFRNASLPWQQRVDDVVKRLTLEDIQTQLASGQGAAPPIQHLGIGSYAWWSNCGRGDVTQNSTAFPQFIGLGASFDKTLVQNIAEVTSTETRAYYNYFIRNNIPLDTHKGLSCFSPNVDLFRDPRWGRGQETFSEDPYHAGELGFSHVTGLHGNNPRYLRTSAGCKHFDVSGGPENIPISRQKFNAEVTERTWRTYFLPAFRRCVEAGSLSLICAYNSINGVPACANGKLLTDILRGEWNFTGYIAADAGEIKNIITVHHYLNNTVETAAACLKAGCNLEVEGSDNRVYNSIISAIEQGLLTEEFVRDSIKPLFYTRLRLGEFDPPGMVPYNSLDVNRDVLTDQNRALAKEAAMKSFVLLKNNWPTLPLTETFDKMAVVGPMANNSAQLFGDYTAKPDPRYITTPLQGLKSLAAKVAYAPGCNDTFCTRYDSSGVIMAAVDAQAVFICLGTGQAVESEGNDRTTIELPGKQLQLLKDAVTSAPDNIPVVLLLFNGGPLDISWAFQSSKVSVILECFLPAMSTGEALYDVIRGIGPNGSPAGRLPYTWPVSDSQIPNMTDYSMQNRTYWYFQGIPLFSFGYGLSYTTFHYDDLSIPAEVNAGDPVDGSLRVSNTGGYDADEVFQVYVSWANSPHPVPRFQLVNFGREHIPHGTTYTFNFTISPKSLAVWDDTLGWVIYPGRISTAFLSGAASPRRLAEDTQQAPSPGHIILTPGQPVAALTPIAERQAKQQQLSLLQSLAGPGRGCDDLSMGPIGNLGVELYNTSDFVEGRMTVYAGGQQPSGIPSVKSNIIVHQLQINGTKVLGKY